MKHTAILTAALAAGLGGMRLPGPGAIERGLYDYARERKFPPPETLARKAAELAGGNFPFASLAEAPESTRVFFTAFRAVAEALEPFYQDDDPNEAQAQPQYAGEEDGGAGIQTPTLADLIAEAGCKNAVDLVDMAKVGNSLMASIEIYTKDGERLEGWSPAQDPAEVVGDLVEMVKLAEDERDKLKAAGAAQQQSTKQPDPAEAADDKTKKKNK